MRIEFDPTNPTEAAAVRAMLTAMAPAPSHPLRMEGDRIVLNEQRVVPHLDAVTGEWGEAQLDKGTLTASEINDQIVRDVTPETDSTGTPWDERIHSTPATTNKDGTWRAKRGVTADQIAAVRAERDATPPVALAEETTLTVTAGMTVTENPETGERTVSVEAEQFVVTAPPAPQ